MGFLSAARNFRQLIQVLNDTREEESIVIAQELTALIRSRVQNDKVDADGQSFGDYSDNPLPQYYFWDESLTQRAEEEVRSGEWFLSYEDFREINGLPTDAKNYTFTGEMWRDTGIVSVSNQSFSTGISIGGQTARARQLWAFNTERDGDILAPSEQEITFVTESHSERVANAIQIVFQ